MPNLADQVEHGTRRWGEKIPNAKLTDTQAREVVRRFESGEKRKAIAADYPVSYAQICRIVNGESRGHNH